MAKNMARIENGIVTNIECHSDTVFETHILKDIGDRLVAIGDTYFGGDFYRDGEKIPTRLEILLEYESTLADAENALAILLGGETV